MSAALDTAWSGCPADVVKGLCELAVLSVKGSVRPIAARRPTISAAMQQLLQLERSSLSAADSADVARIRAEHADLAESK